jgi:hypothetical protein
MVSNELKQANRSAAADSKLAELALVALQDSLHLSDLLLL